MTTTRQLLRYLTAGLLCPTTGLLCLTAGLLCLTAACSGTEEGKQDGGVKLDLAVGKDQSGGADAKAGDSVASGPPRVLLKTTLGDITLELDQQKAPITVKNFLAYVDSKRYDGTIFHRVISTFMIQGGGYDTSFNKVATDAPIKNEATNGLKNDRGTIAMARTSVVDSATNQFFINVVQNDGLNHKDTSTAGFGYAVFGKVVAGLDVVDKIKAVPTGAKGPFTQDCPLTNVVINSAARTK